MKKEIKALIVDDEMHAREGLRTLLAGEQGVTVIGEAKNAEEAVAAINALAPDLVFMDVEMPGNTGLDVVAEVGPENMPKTVFVTAYDQYAVTAFDLSAVDYLLKPFTRKRFASAMERVRHSLATADSAAVEGPLRKLLASAGGRLVGPERFSVRVGDAFKVFRYDEIDWAETDGYYCRLHIADEQHLIRLSISVLEEQLPPDRFARIHRSTIVNLDRIEWVEPRSQGDSILQLRCGKRLRMSRRRKEALAQVLSIYT